jgi:hypothetical protein
MRVPLLRVLLLPSAIGLGLALPAHAEPRWSSPDSARADREGRMAESRWVRIAHDDATVHVERGERGERADGPKSSEGPGKKGDPGPSTPEPSGWLAMGAGLLLVGAYSRRRPKS